MSRGAVGEHTPDRDHAEALARTAHQVDGPRGKTNVHNGPMKIEGPQSVEPVDGDGEERTRSACVRRIGFVHDRLDAGALQRHGGDGASNAAADDECLRHGASPVDRSFLSAGANGTLMAVALRTSDLPRQRLLGATGGVRLRLMTDPAGSQDSPPCNGVRVCIHAGPPIYALSRYGSAQHQGTVIFGDIDIIPAHLPAAWEFRGTDINLVITIEEDLLRRVMQGSHADPRHLEIRSRFQVRDARLEHIGWALKAEMESGYPSGPLYVDSLAEGLAACIVHNHSSIAREPARERDARTARRLRDATSFIEDNLGRHLSLGDIAGVTGLSVSHFTVQFRRTTGVSVHQYVIHRRVDRAAALLRAGKLSINQVAVEVGFCHQSHLAMHMRRVLGVAPREIRGSAS